MIIGFDNTNQTYGGAISGIGGITKLGTGIQTFTGTSSYTGGTIIGEGVLNVNSDAALGATSSAISLSGGNLQAAPRSRSMLLETSY